MAASRHLGFCYGQKWRYGTLQTVHVHQRTKFCDYISNGGRVSAIFRFSKWLPAAILDFVFRPPTKSTPWPEAMFKIVCRSNLYFRTYCDFNFQKFGLERLFGPQNWFFEGVRPLKISGYHRDRQKALPCAKPRILTYIEPCLIQQVWATAQPVML